MIISIESAPGSLMIEPLANISADRQIAMSKGRKFCDTLDTQFRVIKYYLVLTYPVRTD